MSDINPQNIGLNLKSYRSKMKAELNAERYEHTLGVMYTAQALAMRYDYDLEKAGVAGLLHDCAKCLTDEKRVKICEKHNIYMTDLEKKNPFLLHAKVGAFLAMEKYDIKDKDIISAILNHTTGKPDMNLLEKIIYIADYIEPNRTKAEDLPKVRKLAFIDIDKALYEILNDTLTYLEDGEHEIDEMTVKTRDYYKTYLERRKTDESK